MVEPIHVWHLTEQGDGATLMVDHRVSLISLNTTLHLNQAQVNDTGLYSCVANNNAGQASRHFNLKVLDPPRIRSSDQSAKVSVVVNNVLELLCEATGIPTPTLTWLKDERPLPQTESLRLLRGGEVLHFTSAQTSTRLRILSSGRYLQINVAELSDRAQYTCVASNIAGKTTRLFNLTTTLPCEATGIPKPSISWQKNGSLVIIAPVVEDTAEYKCVVSNEAGEESRSITLSVIGEKKCLQIVVLCQAEGSPPPSITWHKDGQLLSDSVRQRLLSSGSLQMAFVQKSDAGQYTCTAANPAGTDSLDMRLTVQLLSPKFICISVGQQNCCVEKISMHQPEDAGSYSCVATNSVGEDTSTMTLSVHTHPSFTKLLADVALNKGERLVLTCGVSGIPPPTIKWTINNKIIPGLTD
ncbi:hypothetical protein XENOCAPTIV_006849 [Xenoophorus captivus]|uniref:Ig-like domain-containing protein n=1 Tax=Xenoophorus captivus TaxID=1517983 RepID=A0ABV0QHS9_9TELE